MTGERLVEIEARIRRWPNLGLVTPAQIAEELVAEVRRLQARVAELEAEDRRWVNRVNAWLSAAQGRPDMVSPLEDEAERLLKARLRKMP